MGLPFQRGDKLFELNFEMANVRTEYYRNTKSYWEVLGITGGLAVTCIFLGRVVNLIAYINTKYITSQAYFMSQFQTRTRNIDITTSKKELDIKANREAERAREQKIMGVRAREFDDSASRKEDDESIKSSGTMAEIEKEVEQRELHACVEEICARERY